MWDGKDLWHVQRPRQPVMLLPSCTGQLCTLTQVRLSTKKGLNHRYCNSDSSHYPVEQCKKGSWEDSVRSLVPHPCLSLLPVRYTSVIASCWEMSTVNPRAWEKSCVQLKVMWLERDLMFLKSVPEYVETGMYWSTVWFYEMLENKFVQNSEN